MLPTLDPGKNFAYSTVDTPPSPADSGTTIVLETGTGSRFPDPSAVGEYNVVVKEYRQPAIPTNSEVLRVTALSGDTMTVVREEEGSDARTILIGDEIYMAYTEKLVQDLMTAFGILAPVGSMKMYGGASAPTGWLICDGAEIDRDDYSALFDVIGTAFGVGDGTDTFNLPDLRGRFPIGLKSSDTDFDALGETGGAKTINIQHSHITDIQHSHGTHDHVTDISHDHGSHNHTQDAHNHGNVGGTSITTAQMASHRHNVYRVAAFAGGGGSGLNDTTSGTQVTAMTLTGSGDSHNHSTSNQTATNQTTGVSLGSTNKTSGTASVSLGATDKTSNNGLSTAQTIVNPYQVVNFIIKY